MSIPTSKRPCILAVIGNQALTDPVGSVSFLRPAGSRWGAAESAITATACVHEPKLRQYPNLIQGCCRAFFLSCWLSRGRPTESIRRRVLLLRPSDEDQIAIMCWDTARAALDSRQSTLRVSFAA